MASTQIIPTRMELARQKRRLATAMRGHKLLKDKRDELMRQFLDLVRENKTLRESVEEKMRRANAGFLMARAATSDQVLNTALLAPKQQIYLETHVKNVMSVEIPEFEKTTRTENEGDIFSYGFAFTASELDDAVSTLSSALPELLRLAEVEKSCRLMSEEIEKTRRRVNALEHQIIPDAQSKIKFITMKLDENERSSQIRLMKIQDMMVAESIEKAKQRG